MTFTAKILECSDDDSKPVRWTLCRPGERVRVEVRWHDEAGLATEAPIAHLAYNWSYERATYDADRPRQLRLASRASNTWSEQVELRCPSFMPMQARIGLQAGGLSLRTSIRLIPRISAFLSTFVVLAGILVGTYATNHVFASLRVTWGDALATLGGVSVITIATGLINGMIARAWPGGLPMMGIPYLVHRALLATVIGLGLLLLLVRTQVISLVNETNAEVALHVPGWERVETLPISETVSFLRRPADVEGWLSTYIDRADRFCPVAIGEQDSSNCRACPGSASIEVTPLGSLGFSPRVIALRCAKREWKGVSEDITIGARSRGIEFDPNDGAAWLLPNPKCEIEGTVEALLRIEAIEPNSDYEGTYQVTYPWPATSKPEDVANLAIAVVGSDVSVPHLRVRANGGEAPNEGALLATTVGLTDTQSLSKSGVEIPRLATSSSLAIEVGTPDRTVTEFEQESRLVCEKLTSSTTSIHAIGIEVPRGRDQVISVTAAGTAWGSTWSASVESKLKDGLVWMCVGMSSPRDLSKLRELQLAELEIVTVITQTTSLPYLEFLREWVADISVSVEAKRVDDAATSRPGSLRCKTVPEATAAVALGPVQVSDSPLWSRGFSVSSVHGRDTQWASEWTPGDSQLGTSSIPWVCWPAGLPDDVPVQIDFGDEHREGKFRPTHGTLTLDRKTCWLVDGHLQTTEPAHPRRCKSDPGIEDQYFRSKGNDQSCDSLKICD